jgi:four helix bundle protein
MEDKKASKKPIRSFRDFDIYEVSYRLALKVHCLTGDFPDIERYELGKQMRRAAVSVPANIAEGYGKQSSAEEFRRFLRMSLGSANEVQVYLDMITDLGYIPKEIQNELTSEYEVLCRRIAALIKNWKATTSS